MAPNLNRDMELNLKINEDIGDVLERRADENGFQSTEEYCCTILQTVVKELEGETDATDEVEERLEDLGYLS